MDSAYFAQPAAAMMGQASFFYYNPDLSTENRQHGHFSSTPSANGNAHPEFMPVYQQGMIYPRPLSSQSRLAPAAYHSMLTPVASPRPMHQKPAVLVQQDPTDLFPLDTDCADFGFAPSTPPLSSSSSSASSPPSSYDVFPTPVNASFNGSEFLEGVKKGCEEEVMSEILAGGEWPRCASPPMTPG